MFWHLFVGDSLVLGTEDGIQMLQGTRKFYFLSTFLLEPSTPTSFEKARAKKKIVKKDKRLSTNCPSIKA